MHPNNTEAYLWVNEKTGSRTLSFNPRVTTEQEDAGWVVYPMAVCGKALSAEDCFEPDDLFRLPGTNYIYWVIYSPFAVPTREELNGFWKATHSHPTTRGLYAVGMVPVSQIDKFDLKTVKPADIATVTYLDVSHVHNTGIPFKQTNNEH